LPASTWAIIPILRISESGVVRGMAGSVRFGLMRSIENRGREPLDPAVSGRTEPPATVQWARILPETRDKVLTGAEFFTKGVA